jgi:hypothetical protein
VSVAALSKKGSVATESEFTCPHYAPVAGTKRCQSYQDGGTCARPDFFLCTEWEKRNQHRLPAARRDESAAAEAAKAPPPAPQALPVPTDLFGNPAPELAPPKETPKAAPTSAPAAVTANLTEDRPPSKPLRGLTTEDIESFKALGVEVCMRSEAFGEIWLVPAYTGGDRKEITPEHAATICRVLEAFPGSQVVAFEKNPTPDKEARA